jgi:quinol monooxygenase YgiN
MSVTVIIKVPGDVAKARSAFAASGEFLKTTSEQGKAAGALHHKFAAGDGEIVIVDEWSSREAFEKFFANPEIAKFMADAGASGPPAVEFYETLETPDAF